MLELENKGKVGVQCCVIVSINSMLRCMATYVIGETVQAIRLVVTDRITDSQKISQSHFRKMDHTSVE